MPGDKGRALHIMPPPHPDGDRVNVSKNLGKPTVLPALPLITPLICIYSVV